MSNSELHKIHSDSSGRVVAGQGHVIELTEANFDALVKSPKLTFVDFWAVWCGPCKTMAPVVERLASKFDGAVNFGKLNVDEHSRIATNYEIQSIPTFMMFKNGRPVDAIIGTMQEAALEQRIRKAAGV